MVSKHRDRAYCGGRQPHWIKLKNRKHHLWNASRTVTGDDSKNMHPSSVRGSVAGKLAHNSFMATRRRAAAIGIAEKFPNEMWRPVSRKNSSR
jgi:hypothetical protein